VSGAGREVPAADLARHCRGRLAAYTVPGHFARPAGLPRLGAGTAGKRSLAAGAAAGAGTASREMT